MTRTPIALTIATLTTTAAADHTRNIMVTGFWNPTNEMVRHFSNNEAQNPDGWQGGNWEGRGYDIFSFFPEFPPGSGARGVGDFEVDYQDTSPDFWRIVNEVKPIAIVTFSRGGRDNFWETEGVASNHLNWTNDFAEPRQPIPSPPDPTVPAGHTRHSSLPVDDIADRIDALGLSSIVTRTDRTGGGGTFLSEYISYHGLWYHDMHSDPNDDAWNIAAGHIHVGQRVSLSDAVVATEETLRTVISHVDGVLGVPQPFDSNGTTAAPDGYGPVPAPSTALVFGCLFIAGRRRRSE